RRGPRSETHEQFNGSRAPLLERPSSVSRRSATPPEASIEADGDQEPRLEVAARGADLLFGGAALTEEEARRRVVTNLVRCGEVGASIGPKPHERCEAKLVGQESKVCADAPAEHGRRVAEPVVGMKEIPLETDSSKPRLRERFEAD